MKDRFSKYFINISDPRSERNQKHPIISLIGTTFLAVLSGINSFSGIEDFVEVYLEELSKYFDFPNGCPSHDTYQRFWDAISPEQFQISFNDFISSLKVIVGDIINIDGKTIRNSGKSKALHIMSAWCQDNQLVLAQEKVAGKGNELNAIPKLLQLLDLKGRTVTIDAIGTQREICKEIITKEGDYVIALKGNQKSLHEDVKLYLEDKRHHEMVNENNDKGHGRVEQRTAVVASKIDWLQTAHDWPGLKSIGKITSNVLKKDKETTETRYYISSRVLSAQQLNDIARSHWSVENQLHWRLDVLFNEDNSCLRNENAAENMNILRKWALHLLVKAKTKPSQSIKSVMRKNSMSIKQLLDNVNICFHA